MAYTSTCGQHANQAMVVLRKALRSECESMVPVH